MSLKKKISWKHEWHLYSAVIITAALTFIVIQLSTGTAQAIGVAFSAIVASFLFVSKSWKTIDITIHKWSIVIATVIAFGAILIVFINRKKQ